MQNQLAILLYLYHPDLYPLFFDLLKNIDIRHTLYLGLSSDQNYEKYFIDERSIQNQYNNNIKIFTYPNAGADNLSFIHQINLVSEPFFIKLHSKKSRLGISGEVDWLGLFLNSLIGSNETIKMNMSAFEKQPNLGMISTNIAYINNFEHLNKFKIEEICNIININYSKVKDGSSVSGTMFMSRTSLFQKYFKPAYALPIMRKMLLETGVQKDKFHGTYTHSLERIYGYLLKDNGMYFSGSYEKSIKLMEKNGSIKNLIIMFNNDCYISMNNNLYNFYENMHSKELYYGKVKNLKDRVQIIWTKNRFKRIKYYEYQENGTCLKEI